jgi:hypothetical protein
MGDSTGSLMDFKTITLSSNTLKINHEINTNSSDNGEEVQEPIISDFGTLSSLKDLLNFLSYTPTAEYRRMTLKSGTRINNMQLTVNWTDKRGYSYPILIERSTSLSIKLLFEEL